MKTKVKIKIWIDVNSDVNSNRDGKLKKINKF